MIIKKRIEINKTPSNEGETAEKASRKDDKIDLFDLDNIDFVQRRERRRGDRRRGYRRIDDRNLVSRAQQEAGTIRDSAATEGYKAGLERANQDIQQMKNAVVEFLNAKNEIFEYIAPDILEISIDIAKKIVKKEIEQDPTIILETILDVLKKLSRDESKVSIKANPAQVSLIKENISEMVSSLGLETKINVFGDDTIEVGGCILQTNNGLVDATVSTQIEIIKEAFKGI